MLAELSRTWPILAKVWPIWAQHLASFDFDHNRPTFAGICPKLTEFCRSRGCCTGPGMVEIPIAVHVGHNSCSGCDELVRGVLRPYLLVDVSPAVRAHRLILDLRWANSDQQNGLTPQLRATLAACLVVLVHSECRQQIANLERFPRHSPQQHAKSAWQRSKSIQH